MSKEARLRQTNCGIYVSIDRLCQYRLCHPSVHHEMGKVRAIYTLKQLLHASYGKKAMHTWQHQRLLCLVILVVGEGKNGQGHGRGYSRTVTDKTLSHECICNFSVLRAHRPENEKGTGSMIS